MQVFTHIKPFLELWQKKNIIPGHMRVCACVCVCLCVHAKSRPSRVGIYVATWSCLSQCGYLTMSKTLWLSMNDHLVTFYLVTSIS